VAQGDQLAIDGVTFRCIRTVPEAGLVTSDTIIYNDNPPISQRTFLKPVMHASYIFAQFRLSADVLFPVTTEDLDAEMAREMQRREMEEARGDFIRSLGMLGNPAMMRQRPMNGQLNVVDFFSIFFGNAGMRGAGGQQNFGTPPADARAVQRLPVVNVTQAMVNNEETCCVCMSELEIDGNPVFCTVSLHRII